MPKMDGIDALKLIRSLEEKKKLHRIEGRIL